MLTPEAIERLSPPVRRAVLCIHEHYARPVPLSEIAQAAGKSERQLRRLFKREVGMRPSDYLLATRVHHAIEHLSETPYRSVEAVALAVGYESASYFVGLFKRFTGCTVTTHKKRLLEARNGQMEQEHDRMGQQNGRIKYGH